MPLKLKMCGLIRRESDSYFKLGLDEFALEKLIPLGMYQTEYRGPYFPLICEGGSFTILTSNHICSIYVNMLYILP